MRMFTQIPNNLIKLPISVKEKIMLITLLMFDFDKDGKVFPSITTLQIHTQLSRPTVIKALNELEKMGFLVKETGNGKHNNYYLNQQLIDELTSKKSLPVTSKNSLLHWLKNFTSQKNVSREALVKNFYPDNTFSDNTLSEKKKLNKESVFGEVSPNPSLTEPEPITEERLAYLNQLACKKDLKTLSKLLTKALGTERDYIKNLISYLKGKTSSLPEPPTVKAVKTQVNNQVNTPRLELTEDEIKKLMIEMGLKREFILKQFEMFKIWVEENNINVKNPYNRFVLSFLSKYDVFRHPENVYTTDITYPFRVYYTLIKEANSPKKDAKKKYYSLLLDSKIITPKEYFDFCKDEGLLSAYDLYRAIQRGYLSVDEALAIEPFFWEYEPRADQLTEFYGSDDINYRREFYKKKLYINKIKELAQ